MQLPQGPNTDAMAYESTKTITFLNEAYKAERQSNLQAQVTIAALTKKVKELEEALDLVKKASQDGNS